MVIPQKGLIKEELKVLMSQQLNYRHLGLFLNTILYHLCENERLHSLGMQ